MIRHCDGTDLNLLKLVNDDTDKRYYAPCDCGARFDDVERMVIYPHDLIHTPLNRQR